MSALGQKRTLANDYRMSALGQKRTSARFKLMSAFPPIADIPLAADDVCLGPKADIQPRQGNVGFGTLADIGAFPVDVRFAPESGH